jgi:hypothetical protein
MGSALYIIAKKKSREFDMLMDGKALAKAEETLGAICTRIGAKRLMDFFSMNPDELADMLGDEVANAASEQWFEAKEGLATVRALLSYLERDADSVESAPRVIEDLRQCDDTSRD